MRFFSSAGARFSQSGLGTTPNMAPPSRRKLPSQSGVSVRSPNCIVDVGSGSGLQSAFLNARGASTLARSRAATSRRARAAGAAVSTLSEPLSTPPTRRARSRDGRTRRAIRAHPLWATRRSVARLSPSAAQASRGYRRHAKRDVVQPGPRFATYFAIGESSAVASSNSSAASPAGMKCARTRWDATSSGASISSPRASR